MLKHFLDMPTELKQYNPVSYKKHSIATKTFDKGGKLHSYDDKPSSVEFDKYSFKILKWHSHGKLHRANGEPPMVLMSSNRYLTFNEQELRHSYNGMPSTLNYGEGSWVATWEKEGKLHRNNNKPASIMLELLNLNSEVFNCRREAYYVDGERHRGGSLPAEIASSDSWHVEDWYVNGFLHNVKGLAASFTTIGTSDLGGRWSLYGIEVSESFFKEFTQIRGRINIPAWAAFLIVLKQIKENDLAAIYNEDMNWDQSSSILWLLRALGVTELGFRASLNKAARDKLVLNLGSYESNGNLSLFQILVEVANSEAQETIAANQRKKLSNV
jgi:hypothetical protein